jgi:hypothetical protein
MNTNRRKFSALIVVILMSAGCLSNKITAQPPADPPPRSPAASNPFCSPSEEDFNNKMVEGPNGKTAEIAAKHQMSAAQTLSAGGPAVTVDDVNKLLATNVGIREYVKKFLALHTFHDAFTAAACIEHGHNTSAGAAPPEPACYDAQAIKAVLEFLSPVRLGSGEGWGYKSLEPTLKRTCDSFEKSTVKKVHALGTLALAHLEFYPDSMLYVLDKDAPNQERSTGIKNPWTGLFNPAQGNVPLFIRFSIANPVSLPTFTMKNKLLGIPLLPVFSNKKWGLEFIPGIGLKFLVDKKKSVDLLAMESLAGQGSDQGFFKETFSPDFSAHAPPKYNTASKDQKQAILNRYHSNPGNELIMNRVGDQFNKIMKDTYPSSQTQGLNPNSPLRLHPFVISIQSLAAIDKAGNPIQNPFRPWRLLFEPTPDVKKLVSSTPYKAGDPETDFRMKLMALGPKTAVYYMIGETEKGSQYRIGKIVLDSTPFPSEYADREFFVQHQLDDRQMYASSIKDP